MSEICGSVIGFLVIGSMNCFGITPGAKPCDDRGVRVQDRLAQIFIVDCKHVEPSVMVSWPSHRSCPARPDQLCSVNAVAGHAAKLRRPFLAAFNRVFGEAGGLGRPGIKIGLSHDDDRRFHIGVLCAAQLGAAHLILAQQVGVMRSGRTKSCPPGSASCFTRNSGTQNEWITSSERSSNRACLPSGR